MQANPEAAVGGGRRGYGLRYLALLAAGLHLPHGGIGGQGAHGPAHQTGALQGREIKLLPGHAAAGRGRLKHKLRIVGQRHEGLAGLGLGHGVGRMRGVHHVGIQQGGEALDEAVLCVVQLLPHFLELDGAGFEQ